MFEGRTMRIINLCVSTMILSAVSGFAEGPAPNPSTAHYEVKFMADMIDHHAMAVQMAQMCVTKATIHEDLQSLCQNMIAAQSDEIEQMQSWLEEWYEISYDPEPKETGQMKRLSSMSGEIFEIEFMQMMIRHHAAAVKEAESCQRQAYHVPLILLCQNIETSQTREIQQMQTWLCTWYGICNWGPKL
jgi:uncharacterized protein (DUF305 family)